jgi:hypothetical protein
MGKPKQSNCTPHSPIQTQMGNQIQSHTAYRTAVKLVHDGVIGRVKEVHSWQSGDLRWMRPRGR